MQRKFFQILIGLFFFVTMVVDVSANSMHVSDDGTGQVLLFPYYTARSGNVSLLSLVNTTVTAKALRVNVREARGGFIVAQFNVYMSAKDVWTAAIVSDSDGARLLTNDTSCTSPQIRAPAIPGSSTPPIEGGLAFSADAYQLDGDNFTSRDRTREGYIEVIEMASIANQTATGKAITHVAGVPACLLRNPTLMQFSSVTYELPVSDLFAPIGGLTGNMSFVNVAKGMLSSAAPTAIENFWLTGVNAPTPRVLAASSSGMDLTSGKNTSVEFAASRTEVSANAPTASIVERYTARFATSIDAVSALLMTSSVHTEYAFTQDQVLNTLAVLTMPTKPYYIFSDAVAPALGPFAALWNKASAQSCDNIAVSAVTREEFVAGSPDDFGTPPPRPPSAVCSVVNPLVSLTNLFYFVYGLPATNDPTYFASSVALGFMAIQNEGAAVATPGKEGGWARFEWTAYSAKLRALDASVYRRNVAGSLAWQPVSINVVGLPVIGFTLSQAAYQTGSPQQNFADAIPLRSQTMVSFAQ